MSGTNLELYKQLKSRFELDIIASGGVSSMADVIALRNAGAERRDNRQGILHGSHQT